METPSVAGLPALRIPQPFGDDAPSLALSAPAAHDVGVAEAGPTGSLVKVVIAIVDVPVTPESRAAIFFGVAVEVLVAPRLLAGYKLAGILVAEALGDFPVLVLSREVYIYICIYRPHL